MTARELARHLDELLRVREIPDLSLNGLQVDSEGEIHRVGVAVDISERAVAEAIHRKIQFLIVHHGLFWGKVLPVRGPLYQRLRALLRGNVALYAAHLPLDLHPELGNNAVLFRDLGWPDAGEFGEYHGVHIGRLVAFEKPRPLAAVLEEVNAYFQKTPVLWDFGPDRVRTVAVVSGKAISLLPEVAEAGVDLLITGETDHASYWTAAEYGVNVAFYGHYTTERLGVRALGAYLQEAFGLPYEFLELPTGL